MPAYAHGRPTPVNVLLLLRNRVANDWAGLCAEFGFDPALTHTGHTILHRSLEGLRQAGLVTFDENTWTISKIAVTPTWETIQSALDISLSQLADLHPDKSMIVNPYFGLPVTPSTSSDVFVLMPFSDELKPVYDDHIKKVAQDLNLKVARADDFFTADSIMSDIWNAICDARLVIADCTGRNPNVFYEIGLAHTIGKSVVLITKDKDDIPFDIRHLRYIEYEYTPRGIKKFEDRLTKTVKLELKIWD